MKQNKRTSNRKAFIFFAAAVSTIAASAALSIDKGNSTARSAEHPLSLSGITYAGADSFYMVADDASENKIYHCTIKLSEDGKSITSLDIPSAGKAVRPVGARDLEACAFDFVTGNVWVSDETRKTVKEYDPKTGKVVSTLEIPEIMKKNLDMERNLGIEGLTISPDGFSLWLCNEESLYVDGKRSSGKDGTTVRIVKYVRPGLNAKFKPVAMYAYKTDKWVYSKSVGSTARSGVSALCALPDGSLLVLERQLSFKTTSKWSSALFNSLSWKIYHVSDFSSATDVRDFKSLDGVKYVPAAKKLLSEGEGLLTTTGNFEGLCLGPRLKNGSFSLIMVSDAGDGYSRRLIQPLIISGLPR